MAAECLVIGIIFVAIILVFLRSNRVRWAWATIPIGILPVANAVASYAYEMVTEKPMLSDVAFIVIIVSIMASCIGLGICAMLLYSKSARIPYISVGFLFNILLGLILINHYITLPLP